MQHAHQHIETKAFLVAIFLIGAVAIALSSSDVSTGLVGGTAVSRSAAPTISHIDLAGATTQSETISLIVGNGNEIQYTTRRTTVPVKDAQGKVFGEIVREWDVTVDTDQLLAAQKNLSAGMKSSLDEDESAQEDSVILFQANPVGSTSTPPLCSKPTAGLNYTGAVRFCPGTYTLTSGITIGGPATVDATGVTLVGPGYCSSAGCPTAVYLYGKDITLTGITLTGWGLGIDYSPKYIEDPLTATYIVEKGNILIKNNTILKASTGMVMSGTDMIVEENVISSKNGVMVFNWWDGVLGVSPSENISFIKNKISISILPGSGVQKYPGYYSNYTAFQLNGIKNSTIQENAVDVPSFSCVKCTSYGITGWNMQGMTIEKNTIGGVNQAIQIFQSSGWTINENIISNVKGVDNTYYSALSLAGGGTITQNKINGNGSLGLGIYDTMDWGSTCYDEGNYYSGNTIAGFGVGYLSEMDATYMAQQGLCTLGVVGGTLFQGNNLLNNSIFQVYDPNPPTLSNVIFNYYDNHPCVDQNPTDGVCENPFTWNIPFWSTPNQDPTPALNPWP